MAKTDFSLNKFNSSLLDRPHLGSSWNKEICLRHNAGIFPDHLLVKEQRHSQYYYKKS